MPKEDFKTINFGLFTDDYEINKQIEELKKEGYTYVDTVFNDFDTSYGYHIYKKIN